MISFDELNDEDKKLVLEQAKAIVEQERIEQNAKVEYARLKGILVKENVEYLCKVRNSVVNKNLSTITDVTRRDIHSRYINMANYLYKVAKKHKNDTNTISNVDDWALYLTIAENVKLCMEKSMQSESIKKIRRME